MSFVEKLLQSSSHVHIADDKRELVERIIHCLINDGRKMLHVVADFDFTLTVYEKDGIILPSTYAVIEGDDRVTVRISLTIPGTRIRRFVDLVARWFSRS